MYLQERIAILYVLQKPVALSLMLLQCDEAKPHCGNCMRRNVLCEYIVRTSVNSPDPPNLRHSEVELTYHWVTSTSQSLSAWSSGATVWQTLFEEIALRHEHVLHLMFALTALHLASCRPSRIEEYTTIADRHYERALASVTHDLANISIENYDAVLLSVQLICFVNWAQGPQPGEYLAFGEHGKSDWLVMFRGIRTTGTLGRENFMKTNAPAASSSTRALPSLNAPEDFRCQLTELLEHVAATSGPAARPENTRAAEILQECYESRYGGTDSEYHVVFAWLYKMPDSFLDRLQHRDAIPLIIFAHFIVLMHEMERFWYAMWNFRSG